MEQHTPLLNAQEHETTQEPGTRRDRLALAVKTAVKAGTTTEGNGSTYP
ncbi:MAG: hypothetical protein AAGN66_16870 [Acidobacteriota bacterium]